MKIPSIASVRYSPGIPPTDAADMRRFLFEELQKIEATLALLAAGHIDKSNVAPTKPREGDIRLADGVQWNPGNGAGVVCFYNGAWRYLG